MSLLSLFLWILLLLSVTLVKFDSCLISVSSLSLLLSTYCNYNNHSDLLSLLLLFLLSLCSALRISALYIFAFYVLFLVSYSSLILFLILTYLLFCFCSYKIFLLSLKTIKLTINNKIPTHSSLIIYINILSYLYSSIIFSDDILLLSLIIRS